jgi:hypothetical protein
MKEHLTEKKRDALLAMKNQGPRTNKDREELVKSILLCDQGN